MFDLAACQNRIKFAEFFGEWFKQKLQSGEFDNMLCRPRDVNPNFINRAKQYGFRIISRRISCPGFVDTILALPYEDGERMERLYHFTFSSTDTKRNICFGFLDNADITIWGSKQRIVDNFLGQMKDLPGYCKSFEDIGEDF